MATFKYGFELEFFYPRKIPASAIGDIEERKREETARLTRLGYTQEYAQDLLQRLPPSEWGIQTDSNQSMISSLMQGLGCGPKSDSSISPDKDGYNTMEVTSVPKTIEGIEEHVKEICTILRRHGADVNKSCGYHLHTSNERFYTASNIEKLIHVWVAIEDVMFLTQPPSRFSNKYCQRLLKPFVSGSLENLPKQKQEIIEKFGGVERYSALNLSALSKHGTIEIRLHSGTLDPAKIFNWIKLAHAMYTYALDKYSKEKVHEIFKMDVSKEKAKAVFELLELDQEATEHFMGRIDKFYEEGLESYAKKLTDQNRAALGSTEKKERASELKTKVESIRRELRLAQDEYEGLQRDLQRLGDSLI